MFNDFTKQFIDITMEQNSLGDGLQYMVSSFIAGNIEFTDWVVNYKRMMAALSQSDLLPMGDF